MSDKSEIIRGLLCNCAAEGSRMGVAAPKIALPKLDLSVAGDPIFKYFLDCIRWYRHVRVYEKSCEYVAGSFVDMHCFSQDPVVRNATMLLSTYARWCLEYSYSGEVFWVHLKYLPFEIGNCFGCAIYGDQTCPGSCPLYDCCEKLQQLGGSYYVVVQHMLEMLRDTTLESVEELGFNGVWAWLPYFEDSTL
jgi:hypothetical protein